MSKFNTCFSTTQYPFRMIYLPTLIQIDIVCRKTGIKCEFQDFLCTNINNYLTIHALHEFLALNMYSSYFSKQICQKYVLRSVTGHLEQPV